MGKRMLCTGMIVGAVVGGLVTLTNREARYYAKRKLASAKSEMKYCLNNPSQAVYNLRQSIDRFNRNYISGAESAVNALEQVENTLEKVVKRKEPAQKLIE